MGIAYPGIHLSAAWERGIPDWQRRVRATDISSSWSRRTHGYFDNPVFHNPPLGEMVYWRVGLLCFEGIVCTPPRIIQCTTALVVCRICASAGNCCTSQRSVSGPSDEDDRSSGVGGAGSCPELYVGVRLFFPIPSRSGFSGSRSTYSGQETADHGINLREDRLRNILHIHPSPGRLDEI